MHHIDQPISARSDNRQYIGLTADLKRRLAEHNSGTSIDAAQFKPWRVVTCVAFADAQIASDFERYLKSGSGHAFANRHFWQVLPSKIAGNLSVKSNAQSQMVVGAMGL